MSTIAFRGPAAVGAKVRPVGPTLAIEVTPLPVRLVLWGGATADVLVFLHSTSDRRPGPETLGERLCHPDTFFLPCIFGRGVELINLEHVMTVRARRDLPAHREPRARGGVEECQQPPPLLGTRVVLERRDRHRAPRDLDHLAQQRELRLEVHEVGDDLEDAAARGAQPARDPDELVARRGEARRVAAVGGAVLGAILGGGKGAIAGATVGAAGGTAAVMAGDRKPATLMGGSVVTVKLAAPVTLSVER